MGGARVAFRAADASWELVTPAQAGVQGRRCRPPKHRAFSVS